MALFVVDSSVAAAWCFPEEHSGYANAVLQAMLPPVEAAAPRLFAYEIHNSVLMGLRRKRITKVDAESFLDYLWRLPIRLHDPESYGDVFQLAERYGLTVYDAAYLDLAMRSGVPLATQDAALSRSAGQSGIAIFQP